MSEKNILPAVWEVPQEFHNRLGTRPGRQRVMQADGHLLMIFHQPPQVDDPHRQVAIFWRKPDGSWLSDQPGSGVAGMDILLDAFDDAVERNEKAEASAADARAYFDVIERLVPVHRTLRHLHQVLQEARKLCPNERRLLNWRDRAYEIERRTDLLHQGVKNALDFHVAKRADQQAADGHRMATAAHRLNLLVAFFFPIATLTAIFGANLRTGIEDYAQPWPFVIVMSVGFIAGVILTRFVTKQPPVQLTNSEGSHPST